MNEEQEIIELDRAGDKFLDFTYADQIGQIDISQASLRFVVRNKFLIVPGQHSTDLKGRQLHFKEAHAALLGNKDYDWLLIIDEGDIQTPIRRGIIRVTGFLPTTEQEITGE
jgi:hypothetical protein